MKKRDTNGSWGNVLRYGLVAVWLLFTVALAVWWVYFALRQLDALARLDAEHASMLTRYHRMLMWEGGTLLLCLVGGGAALAWLVHRERKESQLIREFLAAFTHELKTPLASIRLQAEVLNEGLGESVGRDKVKRLLSDIGRLYLRLENSLFLASERSLSLVEEGMRFSDVMASLRDLWPQMEIVVRGDCILNCDRRALEAVVGNVLQNAVAHGKSEKMSISMGDAKSDCVAIRFDDEGLGYRQDRKLLGKLFSRPYGGSGSAIGLYLVKLLCERMHGHVSFPVMEKGFAVEVILPGSIQ